MTKMFKNGLTVAGMVAHLKTLPQNAVISIASDEEQNAVFMGFYTEVLPYQEEVIIAGLSGTERD